MAGGGGGAGGDESPKSNSPKPTERVEAEATILCEGCNNNVAVALISNHNCSLDAKIRVDLEAQTESKKKRPRRTAFYIFMDDFRITFRKENRYVNVKDVAKLGGEKWKSFTKEEKKVYWDAMERYNKSIESNVADEKEEYETRKLMMLMIAEKKEVENKRR